MSERSPVPIPDAAIHCDHPAVMPPGIYFGLEEERYHAAFALSASGIKSLRISSLDFWARSPTLNSDYEDQVTDAKALGRAYDTRIVEGREVFRKRYGTALDKRDYPDAVDTNEEIRAAIERAGGPIKGVKTLRKADLINVLTQYDPNCVVWDTIATEHAERHRGKTLLHAEMIRRIEIAAAMIEGHPQLSKAFSGGYPQVSVFWIDEGTGVPCKARFDYLKPRAIVDLKSFDNSVGLPIQKAMARAVANYRYHIQAAFYLEAGEIARQLIARGLWYGDVDRAFLQTLVGAPPIEHEVVERWDLDDQPIIKSVTLPFTFMFVFQQKGPAPVSRGMVLAPGITLDIARIEIDNAKHLFGRCWEAYGTDPWLDIEDVGTFDATDFPAYIAD